MPKYYFNHVQIEGKISFLFSQSNISQTLWQMPAESKVYLLWKNREMCYPISQGYIIKSSMLGANIQFLASEFYMKRIDYSFNSNFMSNMKKQV